MKDQLHEINITVNGSGCAVMANSKVRRPQYAAISVLFDFPDEHYPESVRQAIEQVEKNYAEAVPHLKRFMELLPSNDLYLMQELFIRSFDVQALTTLSIGYIMFGDDYKRGELLANLNREHIKVNNDCGHELADHLPNLLRLLSKWEDAELVEEMIQIILAPAIHKMIEEFSPGRVEKKKKNYEKHYKTLIEIPVTPNSDSEFLYQCALEALYEILKKDFTLTSEAYPALNCDFLNHVTREVAIEEKAAQFY